MEAQTNVEVLVPASAIALKGKAGAGKPAKPASETPAPVQAPDKSPLADGDEVKFAEVKRLSPKEQLEALLAPLTNDGLNTELNALRQAGWSLSEQIALLAMRCVMVTVRHGDVWPARKMMQAVPAPYYSKLLGWFKKYGPFKEAATKRTYDCITGKMVSATKHLDVAPKALQEARAAFAKDQKGFVRALRQVEEPHLYSNRPEKQEGQKLKARDALAEVKNLLKSLARSQEEVDKETRAPGKNMELVKLVRATVEKYEATLKIVEKTVPQAAE